MCRSIKCLHHFEPPATEQEIRDSALQYVRKLSGMRAPSRANQAAFQHAVEDITATMARLLASLEQPHGPPRTREAEKRKATERGQKREEQMRTRILKKLTPPSSP